LKSRTIGNSSMMKTLCGTRIFTFLILLAICVYESLNQKSKNFSFHQHQQSTLGYTENPRSHCNKFIGIKQLSYGGKLGRHGILTGLHIKTVLTLPIGSKYSFRIQQLFQVPGFGEGRKRKYPNLQIGKWP